jgi:hypothetical protein
MTVTGRFPLCRALLVLLATACSGRSTLSRTERSDGFHLVEPLPAHVDVARAPGGSAWTSVIAVSENGPTVFGISYGSSDSAAIPRAELIRFTPDTGTVGLGVPPGVGTGSGGYRLAASSADGNVLFVLWDQLDVDPTTNRLLRWTETTGLVELVPPIPVEGFQRVFLSEDGAVAVMQTLVEGSARAFRYTEALGFEYVGPIDGFDSVQPRYLSRDGGTIIGFASIGRSCQDDCSTDVISFRLTDGQAERLGPPAGLKCAAGGVGDTSRGPVIATVCDGSPYAYEEGAGWQRLAGLPLNATSQSLGLSRDGSSIFGTIGDAPGVQAWRWRWTGELTTLHTAQGLWLGTVNEDGTVATGQIYGPEGWDGFLWVEGAGVTLLPGLVPSSMSDAGDRIVGPDHTRASPEAPPALIARNGTQMPLHRALAAAGAHPGDAVLTSALITPSGELLHGDATLPGVGIRAWVARLPR